MRWESRSEGEVGKKVRGCGWKVGQRVRLERSEGEDGKVRWCGWKGQRVKLERRSEGEVGKLKG